MKYFFLFSLVVFIVSCTPAKKLTTLPPELKLKFLDEFDIPHHTLFRNTTIGGLSGIDYDATNHLYYLICDDRSSINPARFYTATIRLKDNKIDTVEFLGVNSLLQLNGSTFPNAKQDPYHTPDPESIRYNPVNGRLIWTSEGERIVRNDTIILENPAIYEMDITGRIRDSFEIPVNMHMRATESGPRQNGVFEGMTFANQFRNLLVSVEEPVYEDGPRAGTADSTAIIRILRYNVSSRKPEAQYGYRVDPVAHPSNPAESYRINGIPDILSINDSLLLVMERSFSTGIPGCVIRIYLSNLNEAEDISGMSSLYHQIFRPVPKKLVLNLDNLGIYIDNIEGMTWGPKLPNGHRTLICVADNNFSHEEITQFLLFELEGDYLFNLD